jgi:hypothetical protein
MRVQGARRVPRKSPRGRWHALQPRIEEVENKILAASDRAETVVEKELTSIGKALRELRDLVKR